MASYLPTYLTSVRRTVNAPSSSESVTYDYSGQDEIRKRQDEASKLSLGRFQQLYDGDVSGSVASGQRIRDLLSSIKSIQPVRVASSSSSSDMGGGSAEITGSHDEPDDAPPVRRPPLAGNPMNFRNDGKPRNAQIA